MAGLIYNLILSAETSHPSTSSPSLITFSSFDDAALQVGGNWMKILLSIYIFLVISNTDYFFLCLFFWEINFFAIFFLWLFLKSLYSWHLLLRILIQLDQGHCFCYWIFKHYRGDSAMVTDWRSTAITIANLLRDGALYKLLTRSSTKYLFYAQFTDEETKWLSQLPKAS